jgi:hypothetical protein
MLRLCSDLIGRFRGTPTPFETREVQILFAGYSWRTKDFRIWTLEYHAASHAFLAREASAFHPRVRKAAFIGDWAKRVRSAVVKDLDAGGKRLAYLEPLRTLAAILKDAPAADTIGGPPQVVRLTVHMNTRPLCVRWEGQDTLFGRPLFAYENVDYWTVDPFTAKFTLPRKFGRRRAETPTDEGPGGETS